MQFSIDHGIFAEMLGRVSAIIEKKSTVDLYECLIIEIVAGKLTIRGTSITGEVFVSTNLLDARDGCVAVNAHMLTKVIKRIPDNGKHVSIQTAEKTDQLIVSSGRSRFKLSHIDPKAYPRITDDSEPSGSFEIAGEELEALFDVSGIAMSKETTRYYLCGVCMREEGGRLVLASTDGHRLIRKTTEIVVPQGVDIIVPREAVEYVKANFSGFPTVTVSFVGNLLVFDGNDLRFSTRLIDGEFPDYNRVIPEKGESIFAGDATELSQAIDVVLVADEEKKRSVKISPTDQGVKVEMSSYRSEGDFEADGDSSGFEILQITDVRVSGNYLGSLLKGAGDNEVVISTISGMKPLRMDLPGDPSLVGIVMPMSK